MVEQDSTKGGPDAGLSHRTTDPNGPPSLAGAMPAGASTIAGSVMLEADLQAHIGRQLRSVYDEVVNEEVPDRFLRLLEELERKQAKQS